MPPGRQMLRRWAIRDWIAYKRASEVEPMRLRPHPYEFKLYYDI